MANFNLIEYAKFVIAGYTVRKEGRISMLAETGNDNLQKRQEQKIRTKATTFSRFLRPDSTVSIETSPLEKILDQCNLKNYKREVDIETKKSDFSQTTKPEPIPEDNTIIENPDEVIVKFPIEPIINLEEKLPFFKSLSLKLKAL